MERLDIESGLREQMDISGLCTCNLKDQVFTDTPAGVAAGWPVGAMHLSGRQYADLGRRRQRGRRRHGPLNEQPLCRKFGPQYGSSCSAFGNCTYGYGVANPFQACMIQAAP